MSIIRRPRTRQPQTLVGVNWSNPLARELKNVFCASFGTYDIVSKKHWTVTGAPPDAVTYGSKAKDFSQSSGNSYSQATTVPPSVGWTLACVITPVSYPGTASFFGFANGIGSSTYDRQLQYGASSTYIAQIYDGAEKKASLSPVDIAVGNPNLIVITSTASEMTIHIKGSGKVSTAVSNSGFAGYSSPTLVIGNCNNKSETSTTRLPLMYRFDRPWTDSDVAKWFANPWQLFAPQTQRIWTPAAASTYTLGPPTYVPGSITSSGFRPRIPVTVA